MMLYKISILLFLLPLFIAAPTSETSAQESLEKYAYRSPDMRRVFRVHDNKKLNDQEILELMKDDMVAQELFRKSLPYRKATWISAGAFLGFFTYFVIDEDLRNNSFSDYTTTQKAVFVGYTATAAVFTYSLLTYAFKRGKSISKICLPCKEEDLGCIDRQTQNYLSINYTGSGLGLSYNF